MTKLFATIDIKAKAKVTCTMPSDWEEMVEDEKINYFLEHCSMVPDLTDMYMDDTFFSAYDIDMMEDVKLLPKPEEVEEDILQ